jgi:pyridoxamine 5'-phosphate oxidase-like protein
VIDRSDVDRLLAANRYLVLGTADEHGQPWATPVFFARLDPDRVCWVSGPDSRHYRNLAQRCCTPACGREGRGVACPQRSVAAGQGLSSADLQPQGPMAVYVAELRHRYLLVRGGNAEFGNELDMTVEV